MIYCIVCSIITDVFAINPAGVAQLVVQRIRNAQVTCSSHATSSRKRACFNLVKNHLLGHAPFLFVFKVLINEKGITMYFEEFELGSKIRIEPVVIEKTI